MIKRKFLFILPLIAVVLLLGIVLALVFPLSGSSQEASPQEQIDALARAATARKQLKLSLGMDPDNFSDVLTPGLRTQLPEYITSLYIGSDFRLHVELYGASTEETQAVKNALKDYSDAVLYETAPESPDDRLDRAQVIASALEGAGFGVNTVVYAVESGWFQAELDAPENLTAAAAWATDQKDYPFDGYGGAIHFSARGEAETSGSYSHPYSEITQVRVPSPNYEKIDMARAANDALNDWLKAQGGKHTVTWYMGHYLGNDSTLHIALRERATEEEKAALQTALKDYAAAVTYERGDYSKDDREAWITDLTQQLRDMGFSFPSWGLGEKGQPAHITLSSLRDAELILSLFGEDSPYPFLTPEYPLLFD